MENYRNRKNFIYFLIKFVSEYFVKNFLYRDYVLNFIVERFYLGFELIYKLC